MAQALTNNPVRTSVPAVAQERSRSQEPREVGEQPKRDDPVVPERTAARIDDSERTLNRRRRKPNRASESEPEPVVATDRPDDRYLREVRQLHRARGSLASDPQRALELARAGQREFSAGALQQEWEGLIILALNALGEHAEAAQRGDEFLAKYPDGPFSAKIRRALGK